MHAERRSQRSREGRVRLRRQFAYGLVAVTLLAAVAAIAKTVGERATLALAVDVGAGRHPISPDIYGMSSYNDANLARELHIPVVRWGGDGTTRYNWKVDSSNAGADWFFTGGNGNAHSVPGASIDQLVSTARANGSKSIITIPMIGYVNKTSIWNCGFSVKKYGLQEQANPYIPPGGGECGNGKHPDGTPIVNNDPLDVSIVSDPIFMQGWMKHLISVHGTAAQGGVQIYQMDNEPGGWGNTHRDVHPKPPGYDELRDRTYAYASMVKATDPSAKTLGPSDFGWPVYVGTDQERQAHGGIWEAEWYLQQMQAYEQQHGVRILDYFDEHYYPPTGNAPVGDANTQALRLRSTRSLWDPTYTDESWIGQYYGAIQLISRFRKWVNQDYPGTKTAITEYNWGGLESLNGALAQADVLGIFGREGLDLATLWGPPTLRQPGAYAFRMYRNYDGKGSAYGDTWVHSTSTDQGRLAIYGAQRRSDGAITLMMINKTGNDLTSNLTLKGYRPAARAQVYTYSKANLNTIIRQPDRAVTATGLSTTYPANSITLIVIPKGRK